MLSSSRIRGSSADGCWWGVAGAVMSGLHGPADDTLRRLGGHVGLLHVPDAATRRTRGIVGQVEVLAQREARVVGRHVDPAQVPVALEDDPEHVVGLAL